MTTNSFKFPVIADGSVKFASTDVVHEARLIISGRTLSVISPTTHALDFFSGKPFHGGLARGIPCHVVLVAPGTPSLQVIDEDVSLSWSDIRGNQYCETVTAWNGSEPVERVIVYTGTSVGFLPPTTH
jgi:hypothetical protein